ncbi:hypothetical protein KIW84_024328 [Lathyrus oleraceus]|uniref:Uncharacterized protein n=1 Tax=Pisum sativum TaxID=3888 RepID=A0A9D5B981_PEA|nr:hypothetical protein KIW84_024328 [Pisum sativum]
MEGVSVLKKSSNRKKHDLYHVIHKVPFGDSPCVKAKHAQIELKKLLRPSNVLEIFAPNIFKNPLIMLLSIITRQSRYEEAYLVIEEVLQGKLQGSDEIKFINKAEELLTELNAKLPQPKFMDDLGLDDDLVKEIDGSLNVWSHIRSRRLPIFEEISSFRDN